MSKLYWYFLTFSLFIYCSFAQISDKRLCVDPECKSPASLGKTLGRYYSPDKYRLSFSPNQDVVIFSKSAGSNEDLWGAEINKKRGYIPKHLVRETKIIKKPELLVDTEIVNGPDEPQVPSNKEILYPSKVKENFEVIDGTTVYIDKNVDNEAQVEASAYSLENFKVDNTVNATVTDSKPVSENLDDSNIKEINAITKDNSITSVNVNEDKVEDNFVESSFSTIGEIRDTIDKNNINKNSVDNNNSSVDGIVEETHDKNEIKANVVDNYTSSVDDFLEKTIKTENIVSNENSSDEVAETIDSKENIVNNESAEEIVDENEVEANVVHDNNSYINDILGKTIENEEENNIVPNDISSNNVAEEAIESGEIKDNIFKSEETEIENEVHNNISITVDSKETIDKIEDNESASKNEIPNSENQDTLSNESVVSSNGVMDQQSNVPSKETHGKVVEEFDVKSTSDKIQSDSTENNFETVNEPNNTVILDIPNNPSPSDDIISSQMEKVQINSESNGNVKFFKDMVEKKNLQNVNSEGDSPKIDIPTEASINTEPQDVPVLQNVHTSPLLYKENNPKIEENHFSSLFPKIENLISEDLSEVKESVNSIFSDHSSNLEQNSDVPSDDNKYTEKIANLQNNSPNTPNLPSTNYIQNDITSKEHYVYHHTSGENDNLGADNYNLDNLHSSSDYSQDIQGNVVEKNLPIASDSHKEQEQHSTNEERGRAYLFSETINNGDLNQEPISNSKLFEEDDFCSQESCPNQVVPESSENFLFSMDMLNLNSDIFIYLVTTAVSVIIFLLGHFALDKSRREGPLIVKINKLEKEFLILLKEKEALAQQIDNKTQQEDFVESEKFLDLQRENEDLKEKIQLLEDQVQTLEKELENSTEVGLELNRMLSEVLSGENAGQTLMSNIEGLQAQLAEQQDIVSNMKEVLSLKETENHELNLELGISNKKVVDLQSELDKLLLNILKLEEDKELLERNKESETVELKEIIDSLRIELEDKNKEYTKEIAKITNNLSISEHNLQLKIKEYEGLKNSMQQIKDIKNSNTLESLLEVNSIKAELEQLKAECQGHCDKLQNEKETSAALEKKLKLTEDQVIVIKTKFDETDRTKLELETKLQVLTNYFKDKEEQLQKELSKYENMWSSKKDEATSTSERIKYLQGEVQNYKAQTETLKNEIVSQEVQLKGQISVLEKKVHENWVSARQAERRLEELKQEAAQLRNRLTLRERALQEDRLHNRMQSPLEQTEDIPVSPLHLENPASPPPLYGSRDHITKSPPILGMPPPFLPPPPSGAPFLPPPPLPFMPPPPHDMFPGDHRPPPLGRMSSPPLNARYSPNRSFSPYDRSPSPSYDESEYGSPIHRRNYSTYNRRRDHQRSSDKFNGRSGTLSSGSDNSNESLEEMNHHNSKV